MEINKNDGKCATLNTFKGYQADGERGDLSWQHEDDLKFLVNKSSVKLSLFDLTVKKP